MLTLIIYAWHNRSVLGARFLLVTLILVEIWIIAQALEMAALALPTKVIWANIQYIPIMLTPLSYLYLAMKFTAHEKWMKRRWLLFLLLLAPAAINIMLWTNNWQWLIREYVYLDLSGSFPTIGKTYGPLFWLFAAYNYGITVITFVILAHAYKEKVSLYQKQIIFLFVALLLPVIANLFQITGLNPFHVDTTPSFLGLSALIISWGIFRYRLFDAVPIARSKIIQEMRIGMIVLADDGRLLDINPAAQRMLKLSDHLIGCAIATELKAGFDLVRIFQEGKDQIFEMPFNDEDTHYWYEVSFTQIKNSSAESLGWLLQVYDITERKEAEAIIEQTALHDELTSLPNKKYLQLLFNQELTLAQLDGDYLTAAFLDLDNFKAINDTYGHDVGDRVLCEVAQRIKGVLRKSDIISRVGGDEFVILFPFIGSDEKIEIMGRRIMNVLDRSFDLAEAAVEIKASIGFSVYPRDGNNAETLLKKADKAMYMVKGKVQDNCYIYKE